MKIYNTLTKKKEEFVPIEPGKVRMYVCGPTVYNFIHIGNARPMIVFDTVRRYMEHKGYEVNYVSNFTDVDDKIIKKAVEEGVDANVISERYIAECKKDMASLNVRPATTHPQATQEICGMEEMIRTLIEKGYAYAAEDGTVYYRVRSFKDYGKLSHKNLDDLEGGKRSLLIVTTRASAEDVIKNVRAENYDMFNISGLVISDSDMTGRTIGGVKVVANMQNVSKYILKNWVDEVFINMESRTEYPQELVDDLVEMGVVVHFNLYNIENVAGNRHAVERLGNYTVLTSSMNYATNKQAFAKRTMDIAGGIVGCLSLIHI